MNRSVIGYTLLFIVLVLLQVLAFNRIALFGYATPFLFLYFILKLPTTLSPNWTMTLSFFGITYLQTIAPPLVGIVIFKRPFFLIVISSKEGVLPSFPS